MKVLKLTFPLFWALAVAAPLAYSADAPGIAAAAKEPASNAHVLSRDELGKLLAQPGKVLVIDVRRPDEVTDIGGLPVYLSIQAKDLEKSLASKGFKVAGAAGAQTYEQQGGALAYIAKPAGRDN
jgi:hypothetical protein